MPLPIDDNRNALQTLLPTRSHVLDLSGGPAVTTPVFNEKTIAVELLPTTDCFIEFGNAPITNPKVYLRADGYFVYGPRELRRLSAQLAGDNPPGKLIVTELE